jgi:hypothetical protein
MTRLPLSDFQLGKNIKSSGKEFLGSVTIKVTSGIGFVDGNDAVLAFDGRMLLKGEPSRDYECVLKSMRLNGSLAIGLATASLDSAREVLATLLPDYAWGDDPRQFCAAFESNGYPIKMGYRNAKSRIREAIRRLISEERYTNEKAGIAILLAGRIKSKKRPTAILCRWDSAEGERPTLECTRGRGIIGTYPDNKEDRKRFTDIVDREETTKGVEARLVEAIRFCAHDARIPEINGNVATRRLSKQFNFEWHHDQQSDEFRGHNT